jgi:hypothetical protein
MIALNQHGIGFDWQTYKPQGGPRQLVRFEWRAEINMNETRMAGRPVYDKVEYAVIQMPGEILQIIEKPATDELRQRFAQEYAAHKNSTEYVPEGTPVEFLFATQPQVVATLKGFGIHVVEDLVSLTPNGIQTLGMGAQEWINSGKKYLEMAQKGVDYHRIDQMEQKHNQEVTALQNQLADQQRQMANLIAELQQKTPDFAHAAAVSAAAQASSQPGHTSMPAVPVKDPHAWNTPDAGMIERRDMVSSKVKRALRVSASDNPVIFKEGD